MCHNRGCEHDLKRHKLEDVKIWTQHNQDGTPKSSTMGYTMACYDVCKDTDAGPHQCHCKRFEPRVPRPTGDELRELP